MSSNRRSRNVNRPPSQPVEDATGSGQNAQRDPRRRTPYVPRQDATRSPQSTRGRYPDDRTNRPDSRSYRPQQPPYRTSRQAPIDDYAEYDDVFDDDGGYAEYEDRVITDDRGYAADRAYGGDPRSVRRSTRRAPTTASDTYLDDAEYFDDEFDDGFIDEDDWYEEEAAAGAYRPGKRAQRSRARSMPRPSVTLPQVSLPRPTVPVAVREAALVQDRTSLTVLGVLVASVVAMALVVMSRVDTLAPGFSTRVSASGLPEAFRTENALWELPLMAGALTLMNAVAAWFLANHSRFSAWFLLVSSLIVQVLIWVAVVRIAY